MSQLILIRHGQADAFGADTDRLTELGCRQAQKLGAYLAARGTRIDEVISGTLKRQIDTEQLVGEGYRTAGLPWPTPQRSAAWNEYDAAGISGGLAKVLVERDPAFAKLAQDFQQHAGTKDRNRYFQRMFEALMERWVRGEPEAAGIEAFAAFHARVHAARAEILNREGSRSVAVFTSGGPIGVCVQLVVQAPPAIAIQLNWRVKNGSLTEFVFGPGRVSLDGFNAVPHLDSAELVSFR